MMGWSSSGNAARFLEAKNVLRHHHSWTNVQVIQYLRFSVADDELVSRARQELIDMGELPAGSVVE